MDPGLIDVPLSGAMIETDGGVSINIGTTAGADVGPTLPDVSMARAVIEAALAGMINVA